FEEQPGGPHTLSPVPEVPRCGAGETWHNVLVPGARDHCERRRRPPRDDRLAAASRADEPVGAGALVVAQHFDTLRLGDAEPEFHPGFDGRVPIEFAPEDGLRLLSLLCSLHTPPCGATLPESRARDPGE